MLLITSFAILLLFVSTICFWEYSLLRKMTPFYYKQGPLVKTEELILNENEEQILERIVSSNKFMIKAFSDDVVFLNYKPPKFLPFFGVNTQRIVLYFQNSLPDTKIRCEIRPFYSAYLLGIYLAALIISTVISENTSEEIGETILISLVAIGIGLAISNFFHPFPNSTYIKKILKK